MSIELMPSGVEYTEVRVVGWGAIPIGHDIVYPPLNKPPTKEALEAHGVKLTDGSADAVKNLNYYDKMVKEYKLSLTRWTKVVSRDPNRGIDNRMLIGFYKARKELMEKDEKQVKEWYEKKEKEDADKKKQQKT